jgi:L-iditol 2-dehydrogenase
MKAFVKTGRQAGEAGLKDGPAPAPGPGEILLRVAGCGVCGSDLHAVGADAGFEWIEPPVILGHEFSGTVEKVGDGVTRVGTGDRVVTIAVQGCGRCENCRTGSTQLCPNREAVGLSRDGGMAEYALVSARHVVPVPEELDLTRAALAEPLAVAARAVYVRAGVERGQRVVVSGPGPIGAFCAMLARDVGAEVLVTGLEGDARWRLPAVERVGLRTANLSDAPLQDHLPHAFGERSPDLWIESSGSVGALSSALEVVRPGGTVVVVGIYADEMTFSPTSAVRRELDVAFSYSCNRADYETALALLDNLDLGPLMREYALEDAPDAFAAVGEGRVVKAVLVP